MDAGTGRQEENLAMEHRSRALARWIVAPMMLALMTGACGSSASPQPPSSSPTESATAATTAPSSSGASSDALSGQTLSIYTNYSGDSPKLPIFKDLVSEFEQQTGAKITLESIVDTDLPTKAQTAFLAGQEPEIITQGLSGPTLDWVADGLAVPVNDYLAQWGLQDRLKASAIDGWRVSGRSFDPKGDTIAGFPMEGFNWPVWYNTEILDKAGVDIPTTFDQVLADIPKIRAAGYEPFVTGKDWTGLDLFGLILEDAVGPDLAGQLGSQGGWGQSAEARQAIDQFIGLRDAGFFDPDSPGLEVNGMYDKFFQGKVAMALIGSWMFDAAPADLEGKVVLAGFPIASGSSFTKPLMGTGWATGMFITRNGAKKIDAVHQFVNAYFAPSNIDRLVANASLISPLVEAPTVDASKLNPLFAASLNLEDITSPSQYPAGWEVTLTSATYDPVQSAVALALLPGTTADEFIAALDAAYR